MPYSTEIDNTTGLAVNAFSRVGGDLASQAVISQFDLYAPADWHQIFVRNGQRPNFLMWLQAMGYSMPADTPTTGHYEQPWTKNLVTVGSITTPSGAAGAPMVITLPTTDMFDAGVNVSGAAKKASFVVEGMDLMMYDHVTLAHVETVTRTGAQHTVTMTPKDPAIDLDDLVTVGDKYFVAGTSFGEGSGLPYGHIHRVVNYTNTFQIVKLKTGSTGSELTNRVYWGNDSYHVLVNKPATNQLWMDMKSKTLLFGTQNTNDDLLELNNGLEFDIAVSGTEGLMPFAINNAFVDTYTPGTYALEDFAVVAEQIESQWSGVRGYLVLHGSTIGAEFQSVLFSVFTPAIDGYLNQFGYNSTASGDYEQYGQGAYMARIGFSGIDYLGYNFVFKSMHEFSEALGAGYSGYEFKKYALFVPFGETSDYKNGDSRPIIGYEYKALGGYQRDNEINVIAGAGTGSFFNVSQVAHQYDKMEIGYVCEIAFHAACANKIVLQRPA